MEDAWLAFEDEQARTDFLHWIVATTPSVIDILEGSPSTHDHGAHVTQAIRILQEHFAAFLHSRASTTAAHDAVRQQGSVPNGVTVPHSTDGMAPAWSGIHGALRTFDGIHTIGTLGTGNIWHRDSRRNQSLDPRLNASVLDPYT